MPDVRTNRNAILSVTNPKVRVFIAAGPCPGCMYDRLVESFRKCPVVDRSGYPYFVHPLTDGVPRMEPEILREVLEWMKSAGNFDCDLLVLPEAMGIPLGVPLSLELGIPYTVVRKKKYGLEGEISLEQHTGYSDSVMYIDGVRKGDRVVVIDDVISTGGTLIAIIKALRDTIGAEIADVIIPVDKAGGRNTVKKETGLDVKTMVEVSVGPDGKVRCSLC